MRVTEHRLYERHGAGEYWIIDPELATVTVYHREETRFRRAGELSAKTGDTLASPHFPGLALALSDLFA